MFWWLHCDIIVSVNASLLQVLYLLIWIAISLWNVDLIIYDESNPGDSIILRDETLFRNKGETFRDQGRKRGGGGGASQLSGFSHAHLIQKL